MKCLSLKTHLNKGGITLQLKSLFPNIPSINKPLKRVPKIIDKNWLSGFTAGDGSFMIIIKKNPTCKTGYQVQATFNIGQHIIDIEQIYKIKELQKSGNVYKGLNDCRIVVSNKNEINNYIKPQFEKYPLMNKKKNHLKYGVM